MSTRGKGNETDAQLRKKVHEILGEVEAAQDQKAEPKEILQRISFYLKQEASLTIPLIDDLIQLPRSQTALLLEEMMSALQGKKALKAVKRTLYRLRQKGVQWERKTSHERPILRLPQPGAPQGYVGAMDSQGSRVIIIARPRPHGGARVYFSIVSDLEGVQRLEVIDLTKKGLKELIDESLASDEFPVVEAPGGYSAHVLREAAACSQRHGKPLPLRYEDVEKGLSDVPWDGQVPLIYQYINEEALEGQERSLKESGVLHKIVPFSSWFLKPEDVRQYAEAIKEAQESHIILALQQKDARLSAIYRDALQGLFTEEQRLLWKRRLEEMAYILWKMGKEQEARMAVSAAIDLKSPLSPIEPNPFIWNLLLKSLSGGVLGTTRGEEGRGERSSLIITP
ncbi:MAG: hypothetical protein A2Y65_05245 [Deltaproteobacteria bacterium RBG_13_52_11]|nr:MAG: hypothetical protein A2Y65_05245 [Deltaproteobacteria bacterium RBG_13_52_11]